MASGGEASESLQCKIWVLKVSIHCEGCKKKVNRILRSIPGVYDCEIDARQHKVTVKASVEPEVLIRKLERSKKHAALLPESKPGNGDAGGEKESKEPVKAKESPENAEKNPNPPASETSPPASETSPPATAPAPAAAPAQDSDANKIETEVKSAAPAEPPIPDGKIQEGNTKVPQSSDAKNADTPAPPPEKPAAAVAAKAESNEMKVDSNDKKADGGKKKGSMPSKEASEGASSNSVARSNMPPPQYMYSYPAYTQPPAYVMSYNMAQPSISQAYYASPMPPASQGYSYTPNPPPSDYYFYGSMGPNASASTQPPSHHDMFSDENPNACNLM